MEKPKKDIVRREESIPLQMSGTLVVPEGTVKTKPRPRPRAGPGPRSLEQWEVLELQERVVAAIRKELPPGWEFMCALFNNETGQKEVCGSVQSTPENRHFLKALGDAMKITTWRTPK